MLTTSFGVTGFFPLDEKDSIERLQNFAVKIQHRKEKELSFKTKTNIIVSSSQKFMSYQVNKVLSRQKALKNQ